MCFWRKISTFLQLKMATFADTQTSAFPGNAIFIFLPLKPGGLLCWQNCFCPGEHGQISVGEQPKISRQDGGVLQARKKGS